MYIWGSNTKDLSYEIRNMSDNTRKYYVFYSYNMNVV